MAYPAPTMPTLLELIAASHSQKAAAALQGRAPCDADRGALIEGGRTVLAATKKVPGACVLTSVLYAQALRSLTDLPAYVVAGKLAVGDTIVFGDGACASAATFAASNPSWDGHAWLVLGADMADASIYRTAYSDYAPPLLSRHIRSVHGEGRGLFVQRWATPDDDLTYIPEYVLTEADIERLLSGAAHVLLRD